MSIPKVKIAVLKNLLIFGEKYLPQSVRLLEGGVNRYLAGFRLNMDFPYVGLPLGHAWHLPDSDKVVPWVSFIRRQIIT